MTRDRAFLGACALLFLASAGGTILWCRSMGGGMPMPGGWTMSMAWMRMPGASDWTPTVTQSQDFWKSQIRPLLEQVADRIPGTLVEEKDFSLVWHYRRADPDSGWSGARELLDTLTSIGANLGLQVLPASKAVEIKTMEMNKGIFYTRYLASAEPRFVLADGGDWKDEALFSVLPASAYSLRVGINASHARFHVATVREMRTLLTLLEGETHVHTG